MVVMKITRFTLLLCLIALGLSITRASWTEKFTPSALTRLPSRLGNLIQEYIAPKEYTSQPTSQTASVAREKTLPAFEHQFLSAREHTAQQGLEKFFSDESVKPNKKLRIAFCGTGGGYRAMILTSGYLVALEDLGLLAAIPYISALSGSTWFLAPWIMSKDSVREYQHRMMGRIKNNAFDLLSPITARANFKYKTFIDAALWPKILFHQPLGFIDFYGGLLASVLFFEDGPDRRQRERLTQQQEWIKNGEKPFPLYTAVSMHKTESEASYNWYEFNPFQVRNLELDLSIPAYAFGSKFFEGVSQEIAPEQSLGFLLGIFGSAVAINADDLLRIISYRTQEEQKLLSRAERARYATAQKILDIVKNNISKHLVYARLFSAQVNNPFLGMEGIPAWLKQKEELTFIDGGIDYNIPIRPLLRPEREIDAIIIGESSGDAATLREVEKMMANIQKVYGYSYERADDGATPTLHLYKDNNNSQAPRIIYVTYMRDDDLLTRAGEDPKLSHLIQENNLLNFDPKDCLKDWCGTFNFDYSSDDFKQLSGIAEFNMKAHHAAIARWLAGEFAQ
jgi:hypothetical protein